MIKLREFSWAQYHTVLYKKGAGGSLQEKNVTMPARCWSDVRDGPQARERSQSLNDEKTREKNSPLRPSRINQLFQNLGFIQVILSSGF